MPQDLPLNGTPSGPPSEPENLQSAPIIPVNKVSKLNVPRVDIAAENQHQTHYRTPYLTFTQKKVFARERHFRPESASPEPEQLPSEHRDVDSVFQSKLIGASNK
jgi:hypothetical protein